MTKAELIQVIMAAEKKVELAKAEDLAGMGRSKERELLEASFDGAKFALKVLREEVEKF